MKAYYSDLVTRFARLYFRNPNIEKYHSNLDRIGVETIKEVVKEYDPEKLILLERIYKIETKQVGVSEAVNKVVKEFFPTLNVWDVVHEFEKTIARTSGLI